MKKLTKFLAVFLLMLLTTSQAWAWNFKLPGDWNGWSTSGTSASGSSGGQATITMDLSADSYEFKGYVEWSYENNKYYSDASSFTDGKSYFEVHDNYQANMKLTVSYNSTFEFGFKDDGPHMWVTKKTPYTQIVTTGSNTAYLGDKLGEWNVNWAIYDVGTWTSSKVRIGTSSSSYSEYNSSADGTYGNGIKVKTNLSGFQFTTTGTYKVFGVLNYCNTNYCTNGNNSTQNTDASTAFNNSPLTWTVSAIPAPSNFTATAQSSSSIKLSWSLNTASHYVIIIQDEDDVPTNGTNYNKGDSFGAGKVVYIGNSTSTTISNLAAGTNHTYYIYSVNNGYYSTGTDKSARTYYTVTYKPGTNGTGSESIAEKIPSQSLTLKGVTFTRNGYMQDGWATSDGGGKAYELGASYTTDANIILYPTWHVQTYPVTFGVHTSNHGTLNATVGGNTISSGDQVDASATVTFTATPATADYVVEGWYSNAACTERIAAAKAHTEYSITLTENTEVYVKFAPAYTVHFGEIDDLAAKGELAVTYYGEDIVNGAQVAEGSNVVFSATNLAEKYTVQGWFADQQATNSLEGVSGYEISQDKETLMATVSEDVNVYVRYFAPEIVSAITLKVDGSVPSVYQIGETITAEPTTTDGEGTKVYNWQLKQDGVPVSTTFTVDGKKVSFNVESTGNYTITLTINDAITGFFNSTCTSAVFEVKEPVYYIVGSHFWGTDNLATLNTKATQQDHSAIGCDDKKDVHLQPTMEKGVYYFGPWTFGQDYDAFWIYDAIKHKSMSGSKTNGYYVAGEGHDSYASGIALVETQTGSSGFYTNNQESSGHSDLGQHNWYLFVKNGKVWFNKNAPDLTAYVRLVVTADKQYYSNEILMPEDGVQSEILSFYSKAGATYKIQKQEPGKGWTDLQVVTVPSISEGGIYTITFTKSGDEITMGTPENYSGDYYVRTDALNSWDDYKTNPKAKMRYTEGARNNAFNYYLCKWCDNENINVHFAVANDYNSNLVGTYTNDVICTEGKLLGQKASVRFMFMHKTGELARAYLCGTIEDQFLRVINNKSSGKEIYSDEEQTQKVTDLKFEDSQDFVYPIDVYAQPGAQIALRAKYKNYYQFFYGAGNADGTVTSYDYLIGDNTSTDNNAYHMQMVYDFKTDRLVAGWIPGDNEIDGSIDLHSDAIITREHQGDLRSIRFANDNSGVLHVKTLYAELQLNKSIMTDGHTKEATYIYDRNVYWISFPFDVRVGDIFGVDGYGTKWVIQKYNGAKRAQIGWFAETSTFWEQMDEDDIMKANVGYSLNLDPDYFDEASDEVWSNGKASVSFRFPSMIHNFDVISNGVAKSLIPEHTCTIDREFGEPKKNHKNTDSNWNVFGIPTFENLVNPKGLPFDSYYIYNPSSNTYTPQATTNDAEFTLKASYSYFIQWGRDESVTWPKASIINELALAPKYNYADEKNYMVELFFNGNGAEDHTYINLKDEAKQDFVLNEDMMKVTNSGQPNIYSFAGAYDVAYNATAFENQTVNLGVIARKNGSYTFSMPKDFSGSAILVDLEDGTATDLNVSNYSVDLNKGTYNNRFQLMLKVEASTPTNIDNVDGAPDGLEWNADGKTKKLLINDQIYLINGGRVYNATGVQLR